MADELLPDSSAQEAKSRARRLRWVLGSLTLAVAVWGIADRLESRTRLDSATRRNAIPIVSIVHPVLPEKADTLVLPGNTFANSEAAVYARTSGYVNAWYKNIGAHVRKGEVLARIDTPDVEQQLLQAQADLDNARAAYEMARATDERWRGLLATDSVSRQDAEQKSADAAIKHAALQAAQANAARLRQLQQFSQIVAPFDGVVTQRSTDIGALVAAGQNAGAPLFRLADVSRLRVLTAVPETYASLITRGMRADISFDGRPGTISATVTSTAEAIDPATRTLQVEFLIRNPGDGLLPGAYAQVRLQLSDTSRLPRIPVTSLLFRPGGLWVAVLADGHRVHLKKVTPGRDFGTEMEIKEGLDRSDSVIANPQESLVDGAEVRLQADKAS